MGRVLGVDVSHYQGAIDWKVAKGAGVEFAIIKCSEGSRVKDEFFRRNFDGATEAGIKTAAYHFIRATLPPQDQFINILQATGGLPLTYGVALDIERHNGLTPQNGTSCTIDLCQRIFDYGGYHCIIYTNQDVGDYVLGPWDGWKKHPLWVANPGSVSPALPKHWDHWKIWQFRVDPQPAVYGAPYADAIDLDYMMVDDTPPPPPAQKRRFTLNVDGYQEFVGELIGV